MPEIREVLISPAVEAKIWQRHGLTQYDVHQVVFDPESEVRWDVHPEHGGRVIIRGWTREETPRLVFVALKPIDVTRGSWAVVTAFAPTRESYGREETDRDD